MQAKKLRELITEMSQQTEKILSSVYSCPKAQRSRIISAIDSFCDLFGSDRDVCLLSVPGRSEILGNHTDHNRGKVLAAAIDRDIIAVVAKNGTDKVRLKSEGYRRDVVDLSIVGNKEAYPRYSSASLILGTAAGFELFGFKFGGFDAYMTSDVLRGSGISSSAAFEVMIGNIFNYLFCDGAVRNTDIAKIAQYAENEYFGKPCGLMDQMACAVGGFVYMDFENPKAPLVKPIFFSLSDAGYSLCIVNTGGNHANLNDDYAAIPTEMKSIALKLGRSALREVSESDLMAEISSLREAMGDRAVLRAVHFLRENKRVELGARALLISDIKHFFENVTASGKSSFEFLQNVYTPSNVKEQGLSIALLITEGFLEGRDGACRVHGGGFAGTIQAYIRNELVDEYTAIMESVFGQGAVMRLNVRKHGACRLL